MRPCIIFNLVFILFSNAYAAKITETYNDKEIAKDYGELIVKRELSEDEHVFIHEKASFIVWSQGPLAGKIYRIVNREKKTFSPPDAVEFLLKLDELIKKYHSLNAKPAYESDGTDQWPQPNSDQLDILRKCIRLIYQTFESKFGDFYPREARYFKWSSPKVEKFIQMVYLQKVMKNGIALIKETLFWQIL